MERSADDSAFFDSEDIKVSFPAGKGLAVEEADRLDLAEIGRAGVAVSVI
jgi:hypothetical protein